MMYPMRILTAAAAGVIALAALAGPALAGPATAHQHAGARPRTCPVTGAGPYLRCVLMPDASNVGLQITEGRGTGSGLLFLGTDFNGAPVISDGITGLVSYGDGGRELGGNICVSYGVLYCAATMTSVGTLTLIPTGPDGRTGPAETLTAPGIALLNEMAKAHVTMKDLRWLARRAR